MNKETANVVETIVICLATVIMVSGWPKFRKEVEK